LSVARGNNYQVWWAADAFGLIWKKEETLELIRKENGSEDLAKQRISNRTLAVDSGTLLRHYRRMEKAGAPIGSGAVESLGKQFQRRLRG
jgi:hypothetical protein